MKRVFKKLLSINTAAALTAAVVSVILSIIPIAPNGAAADSLNRFAPTFAVSASGVTFGGVTRALEGTPVTLMVKKSDTSAIAYLTQNMVSAAKRYNFAVPLTAFEQGAEYEVKIGVTAARAAYDLIFYRASDEEISDALAQVNAADSAEQADIILREYGRFLMLDLGLYKRLPDSTIAAGALAGKQFTDRDALGAAFQQAVSDEARSAFRADFYVSPNGDDDGTGMQDEPFRTIDRAKIAVAERLAATVDIGDITVHIASGEYALSKPLTFTEQDGAEGIKITYLGEGLPTITGAQAVSGWQPYGNGIYVADVDLPRVDVVYADGFMRTKARFPNVNTDGSVNFLLTLKDGDGSNLQFGFNPGDLPAVANISDVEAYLWPDGDQGWMWKNNTIPVKTLDYSAGLLTLDSPSEYMIGNQTRYYLQGAMEFLNRPGEFCFDSAAGKLYYYPIGNIYTQTISVPIVSNLIVVNGKSADVPVSGITFSGFRLQNTKRAYSLSGSIEDSVGAAVALRNAFGITVENCDIHDVGGDGVSIRDGASDCIIYGNKITALGRCGISVQALSGAVKRNFISNNEISNGGIFVGHGSGIDFVGANAEDNVISHNRISKFKRAGILVNRIYEHTNTVEFNDVSDVNTESEDIGCIYVANMHQGARLILNNNRVHHSGVYYGGHNGIYLDDSSHNVTVKNNIIEHLYDWLGGAVMCKGCDISVYNNIFANNTSTRPDLLAGILSRSQFSAAERLHIKNNITYNSGNNIYRFANWTEERLAYADYNLFYNEGNPMYVIFNKDSFINGVYPLDEWKTLTENTYEQNSLVQDPLFMDAESGDYRLNPNSPAYMLGFKDIDQAGIGLNTDYNFADESDILSQVWIRGEGQTADMGYINATVGNVVPITLIARSEKGYLTDISDDLIEWQSGDDSIVKAVKGRLYAISPGAAPVTLTITRNGTSFSTDTFIVADAMETNRIIRGVNVNSDGKISVVIQNDSGDRVEGNLIIAAYSGDELSAIDILPVSFENGEGTVAESFDLPSINGCDYTVKAFLWEHETLRPIERLFSMVKN